MERDTILAAQRGDEAAFAELNRVYAPLILSMADRFGSAEGMESLDREDLCQEASISFLRALRTYDADQTAVSFGLYAKICIRNHMISLLRKQRSRKNRKPPSGDRGLVPEEKSGPRADRRALRALAEALLTDREKTVFLLYIDGKSYREIAFSLGVSAKSVDNALYRAKAKIRKQAGTDPVR